MVTNQQVIRFESGTVKSGKKPIQNVPNGIQIRVVSMITTLTSKHLFRSIPPLSMTTYGVLLADVCRVHRSENNTVILNSALNPTQPTTNPCPERSSHIFIQATSDFHLTSKSRSHYDANY